MESKEKMFQEVFEEINGLRQEGLFYDSALFASDQPETEKFLVHRVIMANCSPYFKVLYTTNIGNNSVRTEIGVPGVTSRELRTIIHYAYTLKTTLSWESAVSLLPAAGQFLIVGLVSECAQRIIEGLNPENCIGVCRFAEGHFVPELLHVAKSYTLFNINQVLVESEEFLELPLEEVVALLANDYANIRDEAVTWNACLRWIEHSGTPSHLATLPLLMCVRLGLLEADYFLSRIKNHPLVANNPTCRPLVNKTLQFLYDLEQAGELENEVMTPKLAWPRIPHEIIFSIGGWSGGNPTDRIETYDTRADRWMPMPSVDPAGARAYHKLAVVGCEIYVIGGFNGADYFSSCRCFNGVTKEWRPAGNLNSKRCYVSIAQIGDVIYAMGGYDGHTRQSSAEKYDTKTNQWSMVSPMNVARSDACATTYNGKIFITGGFNGVDCLDSAEVYDPSLDQWSLLPTMSMARSGVSCVAFQGCIYALGGFNGTTRLKSVEKFDFNTHRWSAVRCMHTTRSNFAVSVIDEHIFAIGGFDGISTIAQVECYNPEKDQWFEATDMGLNRSALASCVLSRLPNMDDYVFPNRDSLAEDKRILIKAQKARIAAIAAAAAGTSASTGGSASSSGARAPRARRGRSQTRRAHR